MADVLALVEAIEAFASRHGGLYDDLWTAVEAACSQGVPDDYMHPVEDANGWATFGAAMSDAVGVLDAVMPNGWQWS